MSSSCGNVRRMVLDRVRQAGERTTNGVDMEIRSADDGGVMVIGVSGRLDSVTSDALDKEVRTQLAAGRTRLVFDLSALDYISSAGLRVLLMAARALRGKGSLALAAPQPRVQQVFDIAGVGGLVPVYESTTEAVGALKA